MTVCGVTGFLGVSSVTVCGVTGFLGESSVTGSGVTGFLVSWIVTDFFLTVTNLSIGRQYL